VLVALLDLEKCEEKYGKMRLNDARELIFERNSFRILLIINILFNEIFLCIKITFEAIKTVKIILYIFNL